MISKAIKKIGERNKCYVDVIDKGVLESVAKEKKEIEENKLSDKSCGSNDTKSSFSMKSNNANNKGTVEEMCRKT